MPCKIENVLAFVNTFKFPLNVGFFDNQRLLHATFAIPTFEKRCDFCKDDFGMEYVVCYLLRFATYLFPKVTRLTWDNPFERFRECKKDILKVEVNFC